MTGLFTHCCIDTSALINLYASTLKGDRNLPLWRVFEAHVASGAVVSHREVRKELMRGSDGLVTWAKPRTSFFVDPSAEQVVALRRVLDSFGRNAVHLDRQHRFDADPWLVALGLCAGLVVVTSESTKRPYGIPKMCEWAGVRFATLDQLVELLGGARTDWSHLGSAAASQGGQVVAPVSAASPRSQGVPSGIAGAIADYPT